MIQHHMLLLLLWQPTAHLNEVVLLLQLAAANCIDQLRPDQVLEALLHTAAAAAAAAGSGW
jgi:hypothetical protein